MSIDLELFDDAALFSGDPLAPDYVQVPAEKREWLKAEWAKVRAEREAQHDA
jgi:hypothetical protein